MVLECKHCGEKFIVDRWEDYCYEIPEYCSECFEMIEYSQTHPEPDEFSDADPGL